MFRDTRQHAPPRVDLAHHALCANLDLAGDDMLHHGGMCWISGQKSLCECSDLAMPLLKDTSAVSG